MSNNFSPPVLILGSERSGTNLLRALLSAHSKIASPPPAGFVDPLVDIQARYSLNGQASRLTELIKDVITLTKTHHNPWDVDLDLGVIKSRLKNDSLYDVFRVVNEIYAEEFGCRCWCSKEPGLFKNIKAFADHLPDSKFVYLIRDGRDVSASMLQGHLHQFHVYFAALNWVLVQRFCLDALADKNLSERIYPLKYESLIEDPGHEMQKLMRFIGFEFESTQLEYYKNKDVLKHSKKSQFWKNLAQPINKNNKGGYKKNLGAKNIEIFESVAWKEMEALGYSLDTQHEKKFTDFDMRLYKATAFLRKIFWSLDPREEAVRSRARIKVTHEIINRET